MTALYVPAIVTVVAALTACGGDGEVALVATGRDARRSPARFAADVLLLESATTAPPEGARAGQPDRPLRCVAADHRGRAQAHRRSVAVGGGADPGVTVSVCRPYRQIELRSDRDRLAWSTPRTCVTLNVAVVAPAGTDTIGGGRATERSLVESVTLIPLAGAGELRTTVPVELVPPATLVGLSETDCRSGGAFGLGATLRNHDLVTPPALASTCANAVTVTGLVPMVKLLVLLPASTTTVGGR